MLKILFISKYTSFAENSKPSRQYFICNELAKSGVDILLVGSRSISQPLDKFWGIKKELPNKDMKLIMLNGPSIDLGFNFRRAVSWLIFEINLIFCTNYFRNFKPNVIVVSSLSILTFVYGVLFKKLFSIPLVLEVRDIYPKTLTELGGFSSSNFFVKVLGCIEKFGYKNADLIISPLENLDMHVEAVIGYKVKFKWIPMGSDDYFNNDLLDDCSIDIINYLKGEKRKGNFIVAYAGSHGIGDCLDSILGAAENSERFGDQIKYIFIGSGPEKAALIKKFSYLKNVIFFNEVPKKDVVAILKNCSLLINIWKNIDLYKYGLSPNKWIDYSMSARPFVVNVGATLKIVKAMKGCIVIEAGDSLQLRDEIYKISKIDGVILDEIGGRGCSEIYSQFSYKSIAAILKNELINL